MFNTNLSIVNSIKKISCFLNHTTQLFFKHGFLFNSILSIVKIIKNGKFFSLNLHVNTLPSFNYKENLPLWVKLMLENICLNISCKGVGIDSTCLCFCLESI